MNDGGYDPRDDAVKSYYAAIEAKRQRGDHLKGTAMRIDDIVVGPRFRKDFGDIDGLAASIAEDGLIQPIAVTPDGRLLAGHRRLLACRKLGWEVIPVSIMEDRNAGP